MQEMIFRGIMPPVLTIVDEHGQLNKQGMANLLDKLVASAVDGLVILGSAGEFANAPKELRLEAAEFILGHVAGRKSVYVGVAAPGTADVIEYAVHAQAHGASGLLIVNPYYARMSDAAIVNHFKLIAAQTHLPIMLYNFPAVSGQDLSPELVKRIALEIPTVVGVKDTVDCISHIREMIETVKAVRPDFRVIAGYDEYLFSALMLDGDGCIPATANFAPQITCGIWKAYHEGNYGLAIELHQRLCRILPVYRYSTPLHSAVKEAVLLTGTDVSTSVLAPCIPTDADGIKAIKLILQENEII